MGLKLTDVKTTIEISMHIWNEDSKSYGEDLSHELYQDVKETEVIEGVYKVSNIDDILDFASLWASEDDNNVVDLKYITRYVVMYDYISQSGESNFTRTEVKGTMLELLLFMRGIKYNYKFCSVIAYCKED